MLNSSLFTCLIGLSPSRLSFPSGPEELSSQQPDSVSEDQKHVRPSHVSIGLRRQPTVKLPPLSPSLSLTFCLVVFSQGGGGELGRGHPAGHPGEVQRQRRHRPHHCRQELTRGTSRLYDHVQPRRRGRSAVRV